MKPKMAVTTMCLLMLLVSSNAKADNSIAQEEDTSASRSRCIEVGQSWLGFWNGRDLGRAFDVFTRDIVYEDVTLGVVNRGCRAAIKSRIFVELFSKPYRI